MPKVGHLILPFWTSHFGWTPRYTVVSCIIITDWQVDDGARQAKKGSDVLSSRKGVVKMLIASVIVYVISYAPAQIPLFYNLVSTTPFRANWTFLVLLMTLSYINSAANPFLYAVFSHNFRRLFRRMLCCAACRPPPPADWAALPGGDPRRVRRPATGSSSFVSETHKMKRYNARPSAMNDPADERVIVGCDRD